MDKPQNRVLVFPTRSTAETAFQDLLKAGIDPGDLALFVHVPSHIGQEAAIEKAEDTGGAAGAGIAAIAGGVSGALAGLGLLVIPGVGPMLAVGPIAAALTGALTGGAVGGFAGALVASGVQEAEALAAERHVQAGRALIVVRCGTSDAHVSQIARSAGALKPLDG